MAEALGAADGTRKGGLLSNLGVLVSYDPLTRRARVTCRPKVSESVVSEDRHAHCGHGPSQGQQRFHSRREKRMSGALCPINNRHQVTRENG